MKKLLLLLLVPVLAEAQVSINFKEATATRRVVPVRLVDVTDGETEETGVAIAAGECKIVEAGGSSTNCAGTLTHVANGNYTYELSTGETDACGQGWIYINDAAAKPFTGTFQVACYHDGVTTSESGTTIGLASGAVDADDQFTEGFSVYFYNENGPVGSACIVDSANTGDTIVTGKDLSAVHTVGDQYIIKPDAACRVMSEITTVPAPGTSFSVQDLVQIISQFWRAKFDSTASEQRLYRADGATVWATKDISDNGTTYDRTAAETDD